MTDSITNPMTDLRLHDCFFCLYDLLARFVTFCSPWQGLHFLVKCLSLHNQGIKTPLSAYELTPPDQARPLCQIIIRFHLNTPTIAPQSDDQHFLESYDFLLFPVAEFQLALKYKLILTHDEAIYDLVLRAAQNRV